MPPVKRYLQGPTRLQRSYERALKRRRTMAASTIQRVVRSRMGVKRPMSYRSRALMQTGETTVTFPAKVNTVKTDGYLTHSTNDLIAANICAIERASTTNQDLDTRDSDVIYLSGFKIDLTVLNLLEAVAANQLYFNIAVISTKARSSTDFNDDFFTSGLGTSRAYDFDNVNYSSHNRHTDPINSDNFVVHWHQRFLLSPNQQACVGAASGSWPYIVPISRYVPIQRQIRFDTSAGSSSEPGFRLVYWCGKVGEATSNPIVNTANAIKVEYNCRAYYREPK